MEVLCNYNLNLLFIYFYLLIFFVLLINYVFFSSKILPEFFLVFFCLNVFFIFFRFIRILSNNISLFFFLEISCLFSFVYLLILFYLHFKKRNKRQIFAFDFMEIVIIKKTLFFFVKFHKIFDIYFLNKFKNLNFIEWIGFFENYLREISFEKYFLNFYMTFLFLTITFFLSDFSDNNISYSLILWFFFNIFFRIFFAILYFFSLYLNFSLTLFLFQTKYLTEILNQTYFYSLEWRFLFKNWAKRNLEQVKITSEFTYTNYLWIDYKRFILFLHKISVLKKNINIFFAFFFILNFLRLSVDNEIALLILYNLNYFCLLFFFGKMFIFRIDFFQDNTTKSYLKYLFIYNWWVRNNKYGYRFYIVPPGPFFKSFSDKLKKTNSSFFIYFLMISLVVFAIMMAFFCLR